MKVLTEEDVEARIIKLRSAEPDKKVDIIQSFGLEIEEVSELPESTIDPLILLLPPLIRSSHPLLQISTLTSFLPFFIPLIPSTPNTHLRLVLLQILPALLEKLNDPKERIHNASNQVIFLIGKKSYEVDSGSLNGSATNGSATNGKEKESLSQTFERFLKDTLNSKSWRSKVESLKILSNLRLDLGIKFSLKPWLSVLVDLLEDSDGNVREQAKETVVSLLSPSSTPAAARSELKKLLLARNVRKTISNDIIARVLGGGVDSGRSTPAIALSGPETPKEDAPTNGRSETAASALSGGGADEVETVYIASPNDICNEFATMLPHFEGKETEHNWAPREKAVVRIRGMIRGGVCTKFSDSFVLGLKSGILEGVSKTIVSLRTTVAQQSCYLMKEFAETLGPSFDPFVEHLLPILAKMAGFTKKIIAERSQNCVTAIIIHTHVHPRMFITHIAAGVADKNIQTRHFSTGHLKTFIDIHGAKSKHAIESTPGMLEQLEGAVKKPLSDVNPAVRDLARQAFWSYYSIWKQKAEAILNGLDGVARKQLEKANPHDSNGILLPIKAAAPPPAKRTGSTLSALLAEKRKAKQAELAAGKMAQESPRIVSGPVPGSPSLQQGMPRSNSSAALSGKITQPSKLERSYTSPESSPNSIPLPSSPGPGINASPTPAQKITPRQGSNSKPALGSPKDLLSQTKERTGSLGRSPPSRGSPNRDSPLRQSSTYPFTASDVRSPGSSTASSSAVNNLRTPQSNRRVLPTFDAENEREGGLPQDADADLGDEDWAIGTPTRGISSGSGVVEDARRAQAAQAESAAQQLMEYAEDEQQAVPSSLLHSEYNANIPITPARPTNGHSNGNGSAFRTPMNIRKVWEDSPRPEAVTPMIMNRLKERKHERSWWIKRQELMDKASPLGSNTPTPSSAIIEDIEGLSSGQPTLRNLQKLALFSTSHPLHNEEATDEGDLEEEKKVWTEDKVFGRILQGLSQFLKPDQNKDLLEQGLVVLWEMVQHQWSLFDGHEQELLDVLFRLRASRDPTILESTNALISLLCQISDPMYFLSLLRSSLDNFLSEHPSSSDDNNINGISGLSLSGNKGISDNERIRNSGWLFGLTSLGMCILRLPEAVVEVEGVKLGEIIMDAMQSPSSIIRQSSQTLLLSIQTILQNSIKTLSFVPNLNKGQKDLSIYYMAQNGILENNHNNGNKAEIDNGNEEEEIEVIERKEKMLKEMEGLMGRSILRD